MRTFRPRWAPPSPSVATAVLLYPILSILALALALRLRGLPCQLALILGPLLQNFCFLREASVGRMHHSPCFEAKAGSLRAEAWVVVHRASLRTGR